MSLSVVFYIGCHQPADSSAWSKAAQLEKLRRGSNSNNPAAASAYLKSMYHLNTPMPTVLFPMLEKECKKSNHLFSPSADATPNLSRKR